MLLIALLILALITGILGFGGFFTVVMVGVFFKILFFLFLISIAVSIVRMIVAPKP